MVDPMPISIWWSENSEDPSYLSASLENWWRERFKNSSTMPVIPDLLLKMVMDVLSIRGQVVGDQTPLVRQWILLRTLSARHGLTLKELADELEVSEKTVRRDLDAFTLAGVPLEEIVECHGRKKWRIDAARTQPGMAFTFDEAIALYLGRRLLEPLAGTVFWDAAQRAFQKIRACLGTTTLKYIEKFAEMFHQTSQGTGDYSQQAELIDQLVQAIEERRIVDVTYRSLRSTEPISYDLYPYGLIYHRGSLYLVGHSPTHNAVRHWKVNRIEQVELSELRFNRPDNFDLDGHFEKSFGIFQGNGDVHVVVRFSSTVARYVEESKWHASQKLTVQKDGCLLAEFDLDGTEEIMRWIMSFGKHAVVIEPEELAKEIAEESLDMVALYSHLEECSAINRQGK
jgi:proteasome accessory factor B